MLSINFVLCTVNQAYEMKIIALEKLLFNSLSLFIYFLNSYVSIFFFNLSHYGSVFESNPANIKFTIIDRGIHFWNSVFGHVKLTLLSGVHVFGVAFQLLNWDMSLFDSIVDMLIHLSKISLQLFCVSLMFDTECFYLLPLKCL